MRRKNKPNSALNKRQMSGSAINKGIDSEKKIPI